MAITSELQKIYGNTERNTGAKTYTLFRGEASDAKPTFAQPGDVFEEYDTGKVYVASRDGKNRTVWTEDQNAKRQTESGQTCLPTVSNANNGAVLKVANGDWALGTDNGLPADFPAEGIANANKFLGFDASGDYAALTAPSGAEKFIVTLTEDDGTWTADKTLAEIVEAYEADKIVVAKFPFDENHYDIPVVSAVDMEGEGEIVEFCGPCDSGEETILVVCIGFGQTWFVKQTPIPTDSNAPFIVTLTDDQSTGNFVGDKTFGEVDAAMGEGRNVVLSGTLGAPMKIVPSGIFLDGSTYKLTIPYNGQFVVLQGAENDYITVTGG